MSTSDFPHVSQKILKGAASRFFIFWMMGVAANKLAENPNDEVAATRHSLFSAIAALLTVFASNPYPGKYTYTIYIPYINHAPFYSNPEKLYNI